MREKLSQTFIILMLFGSFMAFSQTYDILGVKRVNPSQVNAIIENNEVKGYYAFSYLDKANKKENLYNLAILDNNLKQNYSVELQKSKKSSLLESSYNGERFCFSFIDMNERILDFLILDKTGKTVGTYSIEVSRNEAQIYASYLVSDEDSYNGGLGAVKGKGFVRFGYEKEDGVRIDIEMLDNNGKKLWKANSKAESKKSYEAVNPYLIDERVIIAGLSTRERMLSTKGTKYSVMFINVDNGKEYFRLENKNDKYQLSPYGASYNVANQTYYIYGQYYFPDDNLAKDDPRGMYIQEVDLTGKVLLESFTDWEKEMFPMLTQKTKGKMEKNMKTFVHKIVKTADGKIFAIAEQYRKAVSALGVASAVLGGLSGSRGGAAVMKIEIHDMVTFEFDQKMKLKDITVFEKEKTNIQLPQGMGTADANMLGYLMKLYGNFDYSFTSVSADRKLFNSTYVNYDKDKEAGSSYTIGNIAYTKDQKLIIDKIKLTTKPTVFYVHEAKPGYVAIFEYFKKAKKASIRLEKLNL
jgi:hypothetical protein